MAASMAILRQHPICENQAVLPSERRSAVARIAASLAKVHSSGWSRFELGNVFGGPMYPHIMLAVIVLSLHGSLTSVFAESTVPGATPQERASAGIVTGIDGRVVASTVSSAQTRALRASDLLQSGDEIRVSAGSRVEVLGISGY